jgi:hypothetical protein
MRRTIAFVVIGFVLGVATAGAFAEEADAPDLETLLARHAKARGGLERWAKVRSLELKGTWEAFSTPGAFTTRKASGNRWRFDHMLFGQPAIFAYDGEHAWIQGAALGVPEPTRLEDPWVRNLLDDVAILTPLLAGPGEGRQLELIGPANVEGTDTWAIRVSREGFPEEIWHLDASSYLEVQRESRTFDVFSGGIDTPMLTFYDDFREVDGLVLPFHEERHFGTRYHVTDVETVVVNPELDASLFAAPPPAPEPETQEGSEEQGG